MSRCFLLLIVIAATSMAGCASVLHELKPHRLHMLNRNPAPSIDPEFTAIVNPAALV